MILVSACLMGLNTMARFQIEKMRTRCYGFITEEKG